MAALWGMGPVEIGAIVVVILLLFGPKRLPQLGKSIGKTVKAIRDGVDGKDEEFESEDAKSQSAAKEADDDEESPR